MSGEAHGRRGDRAWALLSVAVSLAANPAAIWPDRSYYFRDFSVTFEPLREFFLSALRAGRWPFWNPLSYEGSALLPMLYPFDLLQALAPGPVAASFVLTLHFPLAALGMYLLARELGASGLGACAAATAFALSGFAQSSLNLCLFLEALAWAPFVALTLLRAARDGGRAIPVASIVVGISLTTLAVEFVGQAVLLGLVLVLALGPGIARLGRALLALALGTGLAGLPVLLVRGIVGESLRSQAPIGALERSLHPASLLQIATPHFFVSLAEPLRWGWPQRLFPEGMPYFLSLYVGPFVIATALVGFVNGGRRLRFALAGLSLLALWYALGRYAGLASALAPFLPSLRFPVKAMLTPNLCLPLAVGLGATALEEGRSWRLWIATLVAVPGALLALWLAASRNAQDLPALLWMAPDVIPVHLGLWARDLAVAGVLGLLALLVALGVLSGRLSPARAALAVVLLLAVDLARAASGLNPQTSPLFYAALPEVRPLVSGLGGGRVLSLGYGGSPAMGALLQSRRPGVELATFFLYRQVLNPFCNLLDGVDLAGGPDLHSFIPNPPLLHGREYQPDAIGAALRKVRNAAVARVVSLDPLESPELVARGSVETGLPDLRLHVYEVRETWPHAFVACSAETAADPARALERVLEASFDAAHAVVLESPAPAACTRASVAERRDVAGDDAYAVDADAPGVLVVRDSYTRSWRATLDGARVPVLRANGRHRGVAVPAGRHEVRFAYDPPGLRTGIAVSALSAGLALLLLARPRLAGGPPDRIRP